MQRKKRNTVYKQKAKFVFIILGLPAFIENVSRKRDMQIRKIQQVLVSSIEANSKAWAPMIFQVRELWVIYLFEG